MKVAFLPPYPHPTSIPTSQEMITYLMHSLSVFFLNLYKIHLCVFFLSLRLNCNQTIPRSIFSFNIISQTSFQVSTISAFNGSIVFLQMCTMMQSFINEHSIISKFLLLQRVFHINLSLYMQPFLKDKFLEHRISGLKII